MSDQKIHMSNEIIPFGKYKGQPVEVLMNDRPYLEWLQSQDWFVSRYQNINTLIINNFREPTETPEHNMLQALFLDENFLDLFISHLRINYADKFVCEQRLNNGPWAEYQFGDKEWNEVRKSNIYFEEKGIDIKWGNSLNIEIKPILSHDYPEVLRQMKAQYCNILFIGKFSVDGLSIEQVRKIFEPKMIITKSEVLT